MITYQREENVTMDEFRDLLLRSTLAERRPIDQPERLEKMLAGANLIVTARDQNLLVGVARSLTDFVYCTYLSDLAVDQNYQKQGIGTELIRHTKRHSAEALLILLAAPKAVDYYPKIGFSHHPHCYILRDENELT
jgi:GNAT superfamily N-acetyltransferase